MFVATATSWAFTAQLHAGAGTIDGLNDFSIHEESDGAGIVLPTPVLSACDKWEFAGWIAGEIPYEMHDELTQELYSAGTVYHLSSVSEEFYAVYRYITDRYCEIYVNDQLITGAQYVSVNTYQHGFMYPDADGLYARFVESNYDTWNSGYIDIDAPKIDLDADTRAKLPHVFTETDEENQYWLIYNPHTGFYIDLATLTGISSYHANANCEIKRNGWNTFTFSAAGSDTPIGLEIQTGTSWIFWPEYTWYTDFNIYRQQTIFTSNPDCSASNYTVTLDAGTNGSVEVSSITERGFHYGIVLPAATPNTGGSDCNALWEFAGWAESGAALNASSLSGRLWLEGEVYYPTRDETMHAVYRRISTTWEQVTDANTLQAGEKILIAYEDGDNYHVLSSAEYSVGHNASETVVLSAITSISNAALVWTLEGKKGAWRLKDANGKHLDMTREDYAYSYTYPWSRWSDEFTIAGSFDDFTIRSNYAGRHYLIADGTHFSSANDATGNIHIYRQVTTYSDLPQCTDYTVLFNSGEGTFNGQKNATIAIAGVSSSDGIALSNAAVPVATPPQGCGWYFAGWSVGKGINVESNAPGTLYTTVDTYIPTKDSIELFAVYQLGNGSVYYEQVTNKSDVTNGGTYVIVCSANNKAVTFNNTNTAWAGTEIESADERISTYVTPAMQWTYSSNHFYNSINDEQHRLAYEGNTSYAGDVNNNNSPFTINYSTSFLLFFDRHNYYLHWNNSNFSYIENGTSTFLIYKQKSTVAQYYSWPHCTPFSVVLNACGGWFPSGDNTLTLTEEEAGEGISLNDNTPTNDCSWTLVGWNRTKPLQATSVNPSSRLIDLSSTQYNPREDNEQLYAVYYDGTSIWSSYPSCGAGIDIVEWTADGVIVESYAGCADVPTINGVAGTPNGDGTYTLPFDVASNPCVPVHIQWGTASQIEKTPILVNFYSRLSAYVNAFGDCTNCDVVVAEGGTAIVNKTGQSVRDMTVYPGGRFIIEAGKTFNATSLTMRADGDQLMPSASILGTFNCPVLYHDRRIDNTRYYWMSLPYDVNIADITYADEEANGKEAVYDTDYYIQYYDGLKRAADKGTSSTYWTHIGDITDESYQTRTTLKAGRGYLLGLPRRAQSSTGHTSRTLRFPMANPDWSSEQSIAKTVAVAGSDCDMPQHIGWNLIGNPFLQNYSAVSSSDIICGRLTEYYDESGNWVKPWYTLEEGTDNVPYITIYDPAEDEYTQTRLIGQNIPPFSTAFIQLPDGKTGLQFSGTAMQSVANAAARRTGLLLEVDNTSEFSILATTTGEEDELTVILDNSCSTAYEVGADLMKMRNSGKMNIYTRHNGIEYVFDAISYNDADSIPVELIQPTAGDVRIRLRRVHLSDEIEHIWLIDNMQMTCTDLLHNTYTFTTDAGTFADRLWLQVQMRSDVSTPIDMQYGTNGQTVKRLVNGQLIIQRDNELYNATGIRVK